MGSFDFQPASPAPTLVALVAGTCPWLDVITQGTVSPVAGLWHGDPVNASNACVNPSSITDSTRVVFQRRSLPSNNHLIGTALRLRVVYPKITSEPSENVTQFPVVRVFGGNVSSRGQFAPIRNLLGDESVVMRCSEFVDSLSLFDIGEEEEAYWVTTPENDAHAWDCDGYEYFIVAVERPIAMVGSEHLAFLQGKFT